MKIYLVGGAVRDKLLKLKVRDKDWVVINSSYQQMENAGYLPVGKSFPVFIHPISREEYALARTEKKSGVGHKGFSFSTSSNITLEQDLERRDLTINALAQDLSGKIIDPFGGKKDLKNKTLRHISPAFADDPLRVLRVARFASRYYSLGFRISKNTMELMKLIVKRKELDSLPSERIWKETIAALRSKNPEIFFYVLKTCGAMSNLFPEIDILYQISKKIEYRSLTNLKKKLLIDTEICFSSFCYDLFRKHIQIIPIRKNSTQLIKTLCCRLRLPKKVFDLVKAMLAIQNYCHNTNFSPKEIIRLFNTIDVWRKPEKIRKLFLISGAAKNGYFKIGDYSYKKIHKKEISLYNAWHSIKNIQVKEIISSGFTGVEIRNQLFSHRIQALKNIINNS